MTVLKMKLNLKSTNEDENKLLESGAVEPVVDRERKNSKLIFITVVVGVLFFFCLCLPWYFNFQEIFRENLVIIELEEDSFEFVLYEESPPRPSSTEGNDTEKAKAPLLRQKELNSNDKCDDIEDNFRFDCYPEDGASQEKCEKRGCCWLAPKTRESKNKKDDGLDVPWCFYPDNYPDYYVVNTTSTPNGTTIFFARNGSSYYPNDVQLVRVDVTQYNSKQMNVKVYDANNPRYEVPDFNRNTSNTNSQNADFEVILRNHSKFDIIRKSTGEKLFSSMGAFIFTDQFIQISSLLPSTYVYGLGERRDNFLRSVNWQRFTMFATDQAPRDNSNLYGSHPFLLTLTNNYQNFQGIFLLNSNAMDVILQPAPAVTYRVLGGILDFHIFLGNSPSEVISHYINFIGKPALPPYWALGFHLCRFGYKTANDTRWIWEETRKANIPFDVQWNDIDYMDHRRDFTYDTENFKELPQLVKDIHDAGMHYVTIIDPGIDYTTKPNVYPPFDEGVKQDIFIKDSNGSLFVGKVWSPNGAVFPDFTNPKITDYWTQQLETFHSEIPIDGAWIDMNEPSNFYDGTSSGCPKSSYENPPYIPNVNGGKLYYKTVCMTAKQNLSIHYNVHNLYGLTEAIATNTALKAIRKKRPFIISRSTFPGHGQFAGHWTGDIYSTWEDMQKSIPGILDFNIFGIPLVGADICGFNGNTTAKLCQRWMELGAFYPFSRNHNSDDTIAQDPVSLGEDVITASRKALLDRYTMLPYLYTLFYRAHVFGETVARPLFFEFPDDTNTYGIDSQFLWGSAMMILPVLQEDVTVINPYFPKGTWYIKNTLQRIDSNGTTVTLDAPLDTILLAFRSGYILVCQNIKLPPSTISRDVPKSIVVFLNDSQTATGEFFWDDGDSLDTIKDNQYNLLEFYAEKGKLSSKIITYGAPQELLVVETIHLLGITEKPSEAQINGKPQDFIYYSEHQLLVLYGFHISLSSEFVASWK